MAAEDGYCYKWPGSPVGRWDIKMEIDNGWKDVALGLMRQYTERTNGSYVDDEKTTSVTWHWERCNPDFGTLQGKELQNHLKEMLSHFPVRIIKGKTYVRVRHEGVTKGALVEHVIKHYNTRGGVDFVLGLGDDVADCDMFEVIAAYHRDAQYRVVSSSETMKEVKVFTCCVGRQPSVANYCLYCAEEVFELMSGLYLQIKRQGRYHSMVELGTVFSRPQSI
uniref:Trehalose 6-phosphate phosphatase n=1 Tax=Hemiselmis andersenii TaxID=464988 RepID=A0A7S0UCV1_HEMAN